MSDAKTDTKAIESSAACDGVHDRLLAAGGTDRLDEASGRHVRSCLRCFRTAADLRDLPRIEALLRAEEKAAAPDPGEAFWAAFPSRVADAWQAGTAPPAARRTSAPWRRRLAGFVKMPLPAACAGAAAALVLAHASQRLPPSRPRDAGGAGAAVASAPARAVAGPAVTGPSRGLEGGFADGLAELEDNALESLVRDMTLETEAPAGAASDDAAALRPLPADELELLDDDALATFVGGLGQTI